MIVKYTVPTISVPFHVKNEWTKAECSLWSEVHDMKWQSWIRHRKGAAAGDTQACGILPVVSAAVLLFPGWDGLQYAQGVMLWLI